MDQWTNIQTFAILELLLQLEIFPMLLCLETVCQVSSSDTGVELHFSDGHKFFTSFQWLQDRIQRRNTPWDQPKDR